MLFWWGFTAGKLLSQVSRLIVYPFRFIHSNYFAMEHHFSSIANPFGSLSRLYCYAQKHVRSIRAVTRTGHDESQQRVTASSRRYGGKKKFIKRSPHQLAAYNTSDRKAAVTVGVIMGIFLGETDGSNYTWVERCEKSVIKMMKNAH